MNLAFYLVRFPGFGGIETVTEIIGGYLITKGHKITIITNLHQDRPSQLMKSVKYNLLPCYDDLNAKENWEETERILNDNLFDAIIFQNSYANNDRIICTLAKKHNIPLYIFEHNTPLYLKKIYAIKRWWHPLELYRYARYNRKIFKNNAIDRKWHIDNCTKYVLLSKAYVPEFINYVGNGIDPSKIAFINNPIIYSPINKNLISQKENIVLCICQIEDTKKVDIMIKLWEKIYIPTWKFVIVGDGSLKPLLQNYIKEHSIKNIEWHSFSDPTPFYEKAKIFWMTSRFEGWPMTLIESMQKGCVPIVYNTFSAVKDIINQGENGYIIRKGDTRNFIKQTTKIMNNDAIRIKMAEGAIVSIKKYDINNIGLQWELLLKDSVISEQS